MLGARSYQPNPRHSGESVCGVLEESSLVLLDRAQADRVDIVQSGSEPDSAGDVGGTRFKPTG